MPPLRTSSQVAPGSSPALPATLSPAHPPQDEIGRPFAITSSSSSSSSSAALTSFPPVVTGGSSIDRLRKSIDRQLLALRDSVGDASDALVQEMLEDILAAGRRVATTKKKNESGGGNEAATSSSAGVPSTPGGPSYELYANMPPEGLGFGNNNSEGSPPEEDPRSNNHVGFSSSFFNSSSTTTSRRAADYSRPSDNLVQAMDYSDDDDDDENGPHAPRAVNRRTANIPRLDDEMILNAAGSFVDAASATIRRIKSTRSSSSETSFKIEDSIMDRRKKLSFVNISSQEKRDVFKISAVRRSMRHLNYAGILMTDEALELANRFMELGPARATLLQIGYSSVQTENREKTFFDELFYISPFLWCLAIFRGYHWATWITSLIFALCSIGFFGLHIHKVGHVDTVTGPILGTLIFFLLFNSIFCFATAFKNEPLTANTPIEAIHLSGACYLQLKGLDTLAKAQHRLAAEKGRTIAPEADFAVFKQQLVRGCCLETFLVHFVVGGISTGVSSVSTIIRSIQRGEHLEMFLAVGTMMFFLVCSAVNAHIAINVRLTQKLAEFEIRRVEADIRVITPNLIHRITPRFKGLLHECHMFGHLASAAIKSLCILTLINTVQLVLTITKASFGTDKSCVPAWCFA